MGPSTARNRAGASVPLPGVLGEPQPPPEQSSPAYTPGVHTHCELPPSTRGQAGRPHPDHLSCWAALPPTGTHPSTGPCKAWPQRGAWLSRIRTAVPQPSFTQEPLLGLSEPNHPGRILAWESQYWKTPPSPVAATPAPQLPVPTPSRCAGVHGQPVCRGRVGRAATAQWPQMHWTRTGVQRQVLAQPQSPAMPGGLPCIHRLRIPRWEGRVPTSYPRNSLLSRETQCVPSNVCLDR